jgi:hypothetical protein
MSISPQELEDLGQFDAAEEMSLEREDRARQVALAREQDEADRREERERIKRLGAKKRRK